VYGDFFVENLCEESGGILDILLPGNESGLHGISSSFGGLTSNWLHDGQLLTEVWNQGVFEFEASPEKGLFIH
jgi:hypothetical protein